jgi:ATP-dependent DNA helicase RecG
MTGCSEDGALLQDTNNGEPVAAAVAFAVNNHNNTASSRMSSAVVQEEGQSYRGIEMRGIIPFAVEGKITSADMPKFFQVVGEREKPVEERAYYYYDKCSLMPGIASFLSYGRAPQITPENILQPHISYPYNPLIANVLYSTTYIENWGSGVKRIMEACQKRGVAAPTWTVNGGFVVVIFKRPVKGDTQGVPQDVPQDVPQGVPQDNELDDWIEKQIRNNPQISTEDLAKLSNRSSKTIKRHLAKMPHIRYVGSGYSGHWEIVE